VRFVCRYKGLDIKKKNVSIFCFTKEGKVKINTKHALELWHEIFRDKEYERDFACSPICRSHYNDRNATTVFEFNDGKKTHEINYYTGWNLHHVLPLSKGGTDDAENLDIVNIRNHDLIGDKTSFVIDGTTYQVVREKGNRKSHFIKEMN
jgi:hypothetical protein